MKILIGDDHSVVRKGLIQILKEAYPFSEITEATNGPELFKLALKNDYEIIISDITMPGRSGIDFIKEIKDIQPKTPILILSIHPAELYALRTIKAGASGYINKESAPEELIIAVKQLINGKKYITNDVAEILFESKKNTGNLALHDSLSNREFEVFKLIASGKTSSQIAKELSLSSNTVSTYKTRLLEKMKLKNIADITRYAIENKLF
ncbi:MAG: response regulator transcription factor [Chitinophagaceae bacterium]